MITESREDVISQIKNILGKYQEYLEECYLFGSYAKETYNDESDIDLAIHCKNLAAYNKLCMDLENRVFTVRLFDVHNIAYNDFDYVFDMKRELKENGIRLH